MEDSSSQQHRRTPPSPPAVVWSISWVCTLDLVGSKGLVQFHFFKLFSLHLCIYFCVCLCVRTHVWGLQDYGQELLLSFHYGVLGIELRSSGLEANTFIH